MMMWEKHSHDGFSCSLSGFSRFFHSSRAIFLQHAATLLRVAAYPRNEFMIRDWLGDPVSTNVDVVTFHEPSVAMATMLIGTCLRDSPEMCCVTFRCFEPWVIVSVRTLRHTQADWITPTRVLSRNVSLRSCALRVLNWMLECVAVNDSAFLSETWSALRLAENSTTKMKIQMKRRLRRNKNWRAKKTVKLVFKTLHRSESTSTYRTGELRCKMV